MFFYTLLHSGKPCIVPDNFFGKTTLPSCTSYVMMSARHISEIDELLRSSTSRREFGVRVTAKHSFVCRVLFNSMSVFLRPLVSTVQPIKCNRRRSQASIKRLSSYCCWQSPNKYTFEAEIKPRAGLEQICTLRKAVAQVLIKTHMQGE